MDREADRPFGLLAELTYGCPLHCPYCSNPLDLGAYAEELTTAEWQRVLAEGRDLGVLQLHLSGGEPLLRRDLDRIVRTACDLGLYAGSACFDRPGCPGNTCGNGNGGCRTGNCGPCGNGNGNGHLSHPSPAPVQPA